MSAFVVTPSGNVTAPAQGVSVQALLVLLVSVLAYLDARAAREDAPLSAERYTSALMTFADRVLESGRDRYGSEKTPLFVDGLHVTTLEPAIWKGPGGADWVLCNFAILRLAGRIGDNLLAMQTPTGLFPRPGREWARTGDDIPLALLHLAAAIGGKRKAIPPPAIDRQFFHAVYHGELEPHQKKRADDRTYDSNVYYGNDG